MNQVAQSYRKYLGPMKARLFDRLANAGTVLADSRTADSFSQMTVTECRQYVTSVERFMVLSSRKARLP
jgi:hypothetical protein